MNAQDVSDTVKKYEFGEQLEEEDKDIVDKLQQCGMIQTYLDGNNELIIPTDLGNHELEQEMMKKPAFCDFCIKEYVHSLKTALESPKEIEGKNDSSVKVIYPVRCGIILDSIREYVEGMPGGRALSIKSNNNILFVQLPNDRKMVFEQANQYF